MLPFSLRIMYTICTGTIVLTEDYKNKSTHFSRCILVHGTVIRGIKDQFTRIQGKGGKTQSNWLLNNLK